jgi:hypothetical protein
MPVGDFQRATAGDYSLSKVQDLCPIFGSSFEATVFRLATAHPGIAVAGLLRYRLKLDERRRMVKTGQATLFAADAGEIDVVPKPKYRRQSIHLSEACDDDLRIHWNKSFDESSCVYQAGVNSGIYYGIEYLPNESCIRGRIEAVRAPYQRGEASPEYGDVVFFWTPE